MVLIKNKNEQVEKLNLDWENLWKQEEILGDKIQESNGSKKVNETPIFSTITL